VCQICVSGLSLGLGLGMCLNKGLVQRMRILRLDLGDHLTWEGGCRLTTRTIVYGAVLIYIGGRIPTLLLLLLLLLLLWLSVGMLMLVLRMRVLCNRSVRLLLSVMRIVLRRLREIIDRDVRKEVTAASSNFCHIGMMYCFL